MEKSSLKETNQNKTAQADLKLDQAKKTKAVKTSTSLPIRRKFTTQGKDPLDQINYVKTNSKIKDTD
ncbi:MAG: hypothetical protein H7333_00950, partial [Bdellovibrionales bacterium]|nr:hypothetical protein [Oligoflexia bacterium]